MRKTGAVILAAVLAAAGCRKQHSPTPPAVAATNSYLEAAVKDLLGPTAPVLRLAEPGMCPGHFDVRPSQIEQLRRCRLLLRLDFQTSLDARLAPLRDDGLSIAEVRPGGGLGRPESYLAACRQTAGALVRAGLADRPAMDERLEEIARRVGETARRCRGDVAAARMVGTPVVASAHQEDFCRWVGLKVVSSFRAADVESPRQLDRAVRAGKDAGARLVIANLPEGTRGAKAIAGHLGGKVVVFDNFPPAGGGPPSYDELIASNAARLLEAAK